MTQRRSDVPTRADGRLDLAFERLSTSAACGGAVVALAIVARHVAGYFFLFDDYALLHEASTSSVATLAAAPLFGFFRPIVFLPARAESLVLGWTSPWGWALTSAAWHLANAALVAAISRRLGASPRGALSAALLFLLSAWTAETYFWLSARFDLLAAFGVLLCVCATLAAGQQSSSSRSRWGWAGTAWAAAFLAVWAKESAVALPAVLLVMAGLSRPGNWRARGFAFSLLGSVAVVLSYLAVRQAVLPGLAGAYGPAAVLFRQPADALVNLQSHLRASIAFPSYYAGLGHWTPAIVILALATAHGAVLLATRSWRLSAACLVSFLVGLTPVLCVGMLPGSSAGGACRTCQRRRSARPRG